MGWMARALFTLLAFPSLKGSAAGKVYNLSNFTTINWPHDLTAARAAELASLDPCMTNFVFQNLKGDLPVIFLRKKKEYSPEKDFKQACTASCSATQARTRSRITAPPTIPAREELQKAVWFIYTSIMYVILQPLTQS